MLYSAPPPFGWTIEASSVFLCVYLLYICTQVISLSFTENRNNDKEKCAKFC